ncbi:MAG TPA: MarR family transcriptional regulator [Dehalococcoidales bacterium]|jgi:DNA-binding MarR family transcriptional regulator
MEKAKLIKEVIEFHRRVNRAVRQYTPDAWLQLSMTIPQVKGLFFIANNGTTNFKNLATALKVTPSNLTGVIDRLVDQGLVSRTENPEDRRMIILKATEKGEALVLDLRERSISYLSQALSDMNEEDLTTIARGLSLLAAATEGVKDKFVLGGGKTAL